MNYYTDEEKSKAVEAIAKADKAMKRYERKYKEAAQHRRRLMTLYCSDTNLSYSTVAERLGITRQAVHHSIELYKRETTRDELAE